MVNTYIMCGYLSHVFCLYERVTLTLWVWAFLCLNWLVARAVVMFPPDRFASVSI